MPDGVLIGSNTFNCSVPLQIGDRYFLFERGPGQQPLLSVVREADGGPFCEVLRNQPNVPYASRTVPGIVTVRDPDHGGFLYKIRPDSESTIVFGRLPAEEVTVKINDQRIVVEGMAPGSREPQRLHTIERNAVSGDSVGLRVDGHSVAMGAPLPEFLRPRPARL